MTPVFVRVPVLKLPAEFDTTADKPAAAQGWHAATDGSDEPFDVEAVLLDFDDDEPTLSARLADRLRGIRSEVEKRRNISYRHQGVEYFGHYHAIRSHIDSIIGSLEENDLKQALYLLEFLPNVAVEHTLTEDHRRKGRELVNDREKNLGGNLRNGEQPSTTEAHGTGPGSDSPSQPQPILNGEHTALCIDDVPSLSAYYPDLASQIVELARRELSNGVNVVDVFALGAGHTGPFSISSSDLENTQLHSRLVEMLEQSTRNQSVDLAAGAQQVATYYGGSPARIRTIFLPNPLREEGEGTGRAHAFTGQLSALMQKSYDFKAQNPPPDLSPKPYGHPGGAKPPWPNVTWRPRVRLS